MIRGYSREMGHDLSPGFEVAIYHNINVIEDRDQAFAESKQFLDGYYSVDYRQDMLKLWVAAGSSTHVFKACKDTSTRERRRSCSGLPDTTRNASSSA